MRMIDVLNMMAKGEIKAQTELFVYDHIECIDIYTFDGKAFYNEHDNEIGSDFIISSMFLNYTVELIPPKPKKYYLRLDENDSDSYINQIGCFSYEISCKGEGTVYKTKFTQEVIDDDKLLKFIERHGIKEVVDEDETY